MLPWKSLAERARFDSALEVAMELMQRMSKTSVTALGHRIRINEATEEDIRELRGIGPIHAARIVEDREANGFFHGPGELSRVIPPGLVVAISPKIDWRLPTQEASEYGLGERNVLGALFSIFSLALGVWLLRRGLESAEAWFDAGNGFGYETVNGWRNGSIAAVGGITMLASTSGLLLTLSRTRRWERYGIRGGVVCSGLMLLAFASLGAANAVYYQEYAPGGWQDLIEDNAATAALVMLVVASCVGLAPALIVYWRPALVQSRALRVTVDVVWLFYVLALSYGAWTLRDVLPVLVLFFLAAQGVYAALVGLLVITRQESALDVTLAALVPAVRNHAADRRDELMTWLNARMPKEATQKELQEALNLRFPASRRRKFVGWLITTLGGAAACGAARGIVQSAGLF
jgi:hypothetical protein